MAIQKKKEKKKKRERERGNENGQRWWKDMNIWSIFGDGFGDGDSPREPDIIAPGFKIGIYFYVEENGIS